jgi:hypothetical protein
MHQYYSGIIEFDLHPLCNPTWHRNQCKKEGIEFTMQMMKDNVAFLESMALFHDIQASGTDLFPDIAKKCFISQSQFEVVDYLTRIVGNGIKDMLELPLNHEYKQLVTGSDFDIDIMKPVKLLKSMYEYGNHNKREIEIPKLCAEFYSLKDCSLQQGIKHIETFQYQLHQHGFTHFSATNCDIELLLLRLHPGPLNDMLQHMYRSNKTSWIPFKVMAEDLANNMLASRRTLYEHELFKHSQVASSKTYNRAIQPAATSTTTSSFKDGAVVKPMFTAMDTTSTHTTTGIPIVDKHKLIPSNPKFGPAKFTCIACQTDDPERHYWLQCVKLCNFSQCVAQSKKTHWGNQCDTIAAFNKAKRENTKQKTSLGVT